MTHLSLELAGRVRGSVIDWAHRRQHESVHCFQCEGLVTPWDSCCPHCGQRDPARLSASAGLYVSLGLVMLAMVVSLLIVVF